jgi:uncharacterized protein YjbJ (UPF0337 family)
MTSGFWNQVSGKWKQFRGEVQSRWGKLTDDEMDEINGDRAKLAGKIQERYGVAQSEANQQIDEWADELKERT